MQVLVYGKELTVTQALRDFTTQQVTQKLSKLGHKIEVVRVYLEKISRKNSDADVATAQYKVELPGKDIVLKSKAHDLYLAISGAADAVARKLRQTKEKRLDKKKQMVVMF